MTLPRGPRPGLGLAACHASGCRHRECAAAAAAVARTADATALADAVGNRRRLQALAARGWPPAELARRLRIPIQAVVAITSNNAVKVSPDRTAAIRALYDELWDVPGGNRHVAWRARTRGWPPPLGWDDDPADGHGIDDPDAVPAPGWQRPSSSRHHLPDLIEELNELTSFGCTTHAAAQRLGVRPKSIGRLVSRHRRRTAEYAQAQGDAQQAPPAEWRHDARVDGSAPGHQIASHHPVHTKTAVYASAAGAAASPDTRAGGV